MTFAVLAMVACSNDEILPDNGGDDGGGNVTTGEAWLALSVTTTKTRALHTTDYEVGTAEESNISNVTAVFFDGYGIDAKVVDVVELPGNSIGIPGQSSGGTGAQKGKAFKVSNDAVSVLIIANKPTNVTISNGQTYENVALTAKTLSDAIGATVAKSNEFMMTNAKGGDGNASPVGTATGLEPSESNGTELVATLKDHMKTKPEDAEAKPLSINLDRVVAKVRVYEGPYPATPTSKVSSTDFTITKFEWVLNVANKKYFPVSKRIKPYFYASNVWSDKYGFGTYRIDPNYDHTSIPYDMNLDDAIQTNNQIYKENYEYYPYSGSPTWLAATNATNSDQGQGAGNVKTPASYCLENTQRENDNNLAYTTHVLLQVAMYPNEFGQPGTIPNIVNNADPGDWFIYRGGYYNYEHFLPWIEAELAAKYGSGNPAAQAAVATPMADALNLLITEFGGTPITIDASIDPYGASDITTKVDAIIGAFRTREADLTPVSGEILDAADKVVITYYKAGANYYQIPIKHADDAAELNKLGEFGVVRNSVYDVYVSKISNPGYPEIPKPDPGKKDETDEQWLSVQININPWTWYYQEEEL